MKDQYLLSSSTVDFINMLQFCDGNPARGTYIV
jgi:hypothetical protein